MDKKTQFNVWFLIMAFFGVLAFQHVWHTARTVATIPYSQFEQLARDDKVAEVVVTENHIHGRLKEPLPDGQTQFVTRKVEPDLARALASEGVTVIGATEETFIGQVLSWVLPVLVFFGLWMLLMRRFGPGGMGGGFMQIGKSKARIYIETDTKVTFDDVAGVDEAKEELREIVSFLKDPATYGRLGARTPKGVLLVGPPGTGKTLLARAVAGEAGVPFFSISGSEFVEMFVGVGAARVRDLFEQARAKAPAIIFIDELDALGRARGAYPGGGHDEKETTLNQLLVEMDGFDPRDGLILLAASNRPEILDPALLRAGRFDRQVLVDRPDKAGRAQILRVHLKKAKLDSAVRVEELAALTPGFSGADLANLINEAAIIATRRGGEAVAMADFTAAVERIVAGLERRNRLLNPFERKVVAYHEMGHALVALSLTGTDPVHKVSIIPRGVGALGYTIQRPTEDRFLMTREELENKMAVLLGGRAAEHIVFGHLSTGAADDLAKVTDIARGMVVRYGMSDALGHVAYETDRSSPLLGPVPGGGMAERRYSDETAREIDREVRGIVDTAFQRAVDILTRRRADLERSAARLLEKETLDEVDLRSLIGTAASEPAPSRPPAPSGAGA
ncbi:ATP-dependent zinc metalloprotease FtsH [Azospirillum thermophilum]|uniref:ATP-dependent zinc metalloprotease FtsH n=1 Tax=Azospirillum thermophilum TaxID=2202148 RepID=A0A2S2CNE6_9PROT|nr:ATP-dependent zinc metalloprotease FtsH [Azospirillum thermophilum]AWK86012.1 cell division protein FtsH [Azospirillum thermophilum]